ncbi:phage portal protein [Schinkia azotoformans]|uniref:phage portal protein n=1 Tax=Schinkia azotoformans TaxID=1454 RepID=UPI002DBA66CC|nr:phage portal protein [Schinkia azotoformans]MEC1714750.1 phage portal protein [Schinkia azotoformans]MEC1757494.1 phage portal protein [Schinkia azotoformans]
MTINYENQAFPPDPFNKYIETIQYYRALYDGNHEDIFPRAQQLFDSDIRSKIQYRKHPRRYFRYGYQEPKVMLPHYVVVNFSSVVAELPADLINRSLGNISGDTEKDQQLLDYVKQVEKFSKIQKKIWPAVVQHQIDGAIAYRCRWTKEKGAWFEFKPVDMYFEHDDEMGADIAWIEERGKDKYLRVERQRLEANQLLIQQLVFIMEGEKVKEQMDTQTYAQQYGIVIPEDQVLNGVDELMCDFLPNDETLLEPRGRSGLRNIDTIQDEINWTITRDSIVFEKHGKPKLAIPRRLWDSVAQTNDKMYGQRFVRNADLEVVSYDENNGATPQYITWDAQTEQSFEHVKRLIEYMLAVSKTSPQAVGLKDGKGDSGIALLYLWIQSVIKAEAIKDKFDSFIKDAFRKCIILENTLGSNQIDVKDPVIEWGDMLPKAESERDTEEATKYEAGVQSLETTIRNIHPDWSEEAIMAELEKIQEEQAADSFNIGLNQPPKVELDD